MTRNQMQRDPSNTFIAGSFSDARSYALMSASVNDDDASKAGYPKSDEAVVPQGRYVVIEAAVSAVNSIAEELQHVSRLSNSDSITKSYNSRDSYGSVVDVSGHFNSLLSLSIK